LPGAEQPPDRHKGREKGIEEQGRCAAGTSIRALGKKDGKDGQDEDEFNGSNDGEKLRCQLRGTIQSRLETTNVERCRDSGKSKGCDARKVVIVDLHRPIGRTTQRLAHSDEIERSVNKKQRRPDRLSAVLCVLSW
jgi:hypothetical protein